MNATAQRPVERWLARYADGFRNEANRRLHLIVVPVLVWTAVALLWCIPVFGTWMKSGVWAALAMFAAWSFYNRMSRSLGLGLLGMFIAMAWFTRWLESVLGLHNLFWLALAVFVPAWIVHLLGLRLEARNTSPSFDPARALIAPAWVVASFYRVMGWKY